MSAILISLKIAVISTVITFVAGCAAARLVLNLNKFKGVVDSFLTAPMVLPPTVVGFVLLLIFGKNGAVGAALDKIGVSIVFTQTGAVIAAAVVSFPLVYRTARGAFEQMDENLIFAARTLGMSERSIFFKITFPNCWPGVCSGAILAFARALGEFGATAMIAGNIPGRTQTVSLAIYSAVAGNNREKAYMWVAVIMAISFVSIILMNLLSQRGVDANRRY